MTITPARPTTAPLRWGVVGTGDITQALVEDIAGVDNAVVAAACSRDDDRAAAFAQRHGIPAAYGKLADLLADSSVDVVHVGTPHGTHHRIATAALEAGKHVVVEKPMALNTGEVLDLVSTARRMDRFLMEAMWTKFSPAILSLLQVVREGAIGEVRSVQASFGAAFPRDRGSRWNAELGGSALLDQGIYPVVLARLLLGEPSRIVASGVQYAPGVDATQWMTFGYDNGRFAQLASSMVEWIEPSAAVNGTDGWISVDVPFWAPAAFTVHAGSFQEMSSRPEARHEHPLRGNGYAPMIAAVTEAILAGAREHHLHTLEDSIATFRLLDRIRKHLPHVPAPL